jgi:ferredoxin
VQHFLQRHWQKRKGVNKAMMANWGYQDGSGKYFIRIDTDKCDGCGACEDVCPQDVLEVGEDPVDPMRDEPVAFVSEEQRKKLKFVCSSCKNYQASNEGTATGELTPEILANELKNLPCVAACERKAITHSW